MGITAVWGPPHSGKTTLAIDLAHALPGSGSSVLLISPELYGELSTRLGVRIVGEKSLNAAQKNKESLEQVVHKLDDLLFVLAAPYDNDAFGEGLSEQAAKHILLQANELFDAVIVDCPPNTDSVLAAWAIRDAEHLLLTCGAQSSAAAWHRAYGKAIDALEDKTLHICDAVKETFSYDSLLTLLDITPEVWLPYIPDSDEKPVLYQSSGKPGKAYTKAINELCSMLEIKEDDAE